jgi:hypothetical protein
VPVTPALNRTYALINAATSLQSATMEKRSEMTRN